MISTLTRWATSATLAVLAPLALAHSPALAADGEQPPTLAELARATGAAPTAPSVRAAAVTSPYGVPDPAGDCRRADGSALGARCDIRAFRAINATGAVTLTSRFEAPPTFRANTSQGVSWFIDDPRQSGGPEYFAAIFNFRGTVVGAVIDERSGALTCATIDEEGARPLPDFSISSDRQSFTQRVPKRCIGGSGLVSVAASSLRYDGQGRPAVDFAPQDGQGRGVLSPPIRVG